jgi:hypothetical protein
MSEQEKQSQETINEAEAIANTPTDVKQLYPHERMLTEAIGQVAGIAQLRDTELISALERILRYLKYHLAQHKAQKGPTGK